MGMRVDLVTPAVSPALAFPVGNNAISGCAALRVTQPDSCPVTIARARLFDHVDPPSALQNLDVKTSRTIWNRAGDVHATTRALVAPDFVDVRATIIDLDLNLTIDGA